MEITQSGNFGRKNAVLRVNLYVLLEEDVTWS